MPHDAADPRIKAAFAMALGVIKDFGMDEAGLRQMRTPAYLLVGASDTRTPPHENARFAADNVPGAQLNVIPGEVDHEIFVNECTQLGSDEFPETCIDATTVDRAAVRRQIAAAMQFFETYLNGT